MILNPASNVSLKVDKLKLELDLLDVEAGSHGINIQGKVFKVHNWREPLLGWNGGPL